MCTLVRLSFFLPLLFSAALFAQEAFAPPGAEWCYRGYDGNFETLGLVVVRFERDTVVRGQPMQVMSIRSKIQTGRGLVDNFFVASELMWQSQDSVFYYVPDIRASVYLYKVSYELDEVTTTFLYPEDFYVSEVNELTIDGSLVQEAKMNLAPELNRDLPVTMYGPLGPDRGFIENWGGFLEGLGGLDLQAFRAEPVPEIKVRPRNQCFALMDQEVEIPIVQTPINDCALVPGPNPVGAQDELTLRFDCREEVIGDFELRFFDVLGRSVGSVIRPDRFPHRISTRELPNGKYFGVVNGEGSRHTFTFVKNR